MLVLIVAEVEPILMDETKQSAEFDESVASVGLCCLIRERFLKRLRLHWLLEFIRQVIVLTSLSQTGQTQLPVISDKTMLQSFHFDDNN